MLGRAAGDEFGITPDDMGSMMPDTGIETMDTPDFDMSGGMPEQDFGEIASVTVVPNGRGDVTTISKNDGDDTMYAVRPGETLDQREPVWSDAEYSNPRTGWDGAVAVKDNIFGTSTVDGKEEYLGPNRETTLRIKSPGDIGGFRRIKTGNDPTQRRNYPYLSGARVDNMSAGEFKQKYGNINITP